METITIAVVSPDKDYNRAFGLALVDACRQLEITTYTTEEFVLQREEHDGPGEFYEKYDLILWAGDEIREAYGDSIIYLTDRTSLVCLDHENRRYVLYKYSRADCIVAAVFDIYSHLTGRQAPFMKRNDVKVLAFASYCGGSGCTTVMRAVSQELVRFRGRRVFCFSLEDVESSLDFQPLREDVRTEGEYLYRLLGRNSLPFLESYLVKDAFGVGSFAPAAGKNPLRELSGGEIQRLLAALMNSASFDIIAIDLSTCMGEGAMTVCEMADRICLLAKTSETGMRENSYMLQLVNSCGESVRNKIIRTERFDEMPAPLTPLEGKFGQEISKLTERLLDVVK